jgi:transposase-like protein
VELPVRLVLVRLAVRRSLPAIAVILAIVVAISARVLHGAPMKALAIPCRVEGCGKPSVPGQDLCRQCIVDERARKKARSLADLKCANGWCTNAARPGDVLCAPCNALQKRIEAEAAAKLAATTTEPEPLVELAERMGPPPTTVLATAIAPEPTEPEPAAMVASEPIRPRWGEKAMSDGRDGAPVARNQVDDDDPTPVAMPRPIFEATRALARDVAKLELSPGGRRLYTDEIKARTLALVKRAAAERVSVHRVAPHLDISHSLIEQWIKKAAGAPDMPKHQSKPTTTTREREREAPRAPARKSSASGGELERLQSFADDVDAVLRLTPKVLSPEAALEAIRSALHALDE